MTAEKKLSEAFVIDKDGLLIANPDSPWQRYLNDYVRKLEAGEKPKGYQEWARENGEPESLR